MCAFEEGEIIDEPVKFFTCLKCKQEIEYGEFFEHEDPTFDYGFYILDTCFPAVGVEIVKGVDLCQWCVPNMYRGDNKNV